MRHRRPLINPFRLPLSKVLASLLLSSHLPLHAQSEPLKLLRLRAFNPVKVINGHTIHDFNDDGWDDLWVMMRQFPTGGGKLTDFTTEPDTDYDKDGVTNYNEMLAGTDPWPAPEKPVLTPDELAERQRKAAEIAEREKIKAQTWQKLLRETTRPSFAAGSSDADSIRHDHAEWRTKVTVERIWPS